MLKLTNIIKYLNFSDHELVPSFIESELINQHINYIWLNTSTLSVGYKIPIFTKEEYVLPILTAYDIYLKNLTNVLILFEYYKRKRRELLIIRYKFLCKEFIKLPETIIMKILLY
jgi:hypothetical protein